MNYFTKFCGAMALCASFAAESATPYLTIVSTMNHEKDGFNVSVVNREPEALVCKSIQATLFVMSHTSECTPAPGELIEKEFNLESNKLMVFEEVGKDLIDTFAEKGFQVCRQLDFRLDCKKEAGN